jgi:very-short-patch-repair endonuclease
VFLGPPGAVLKRTTRESITLTKNITPYNPKLKEPARDLRKNSTLSEVLLWQQIQKRQIGGYKFLRQKPIQNYIVDFYCKELMLSIEIDGDSHNVKLDSDRKRQSDLELIGIRFLRFLDIDMKKNMEGVLIAIRKCIEGIEKGCSDVDAVYTHYTPYTPLRPPQGGNK